jgi:hypothetical protein
MKSIPPKKPIPDCLEQSKWLFTEVVGFRLKETLNFRYVGDEKWRQFSDFSIFCVEQKAELSQEV